MVFKKIIKIKIKFKYLSKAFKVSIVALLIALTSSFMFKDSVVLGADTPEASLGIDEFETWQIAPINGINATTKQTLGVLGKRTKYRLTKNTTIYIPDKTESDEARGDSALEILGHVSLYIPAGVLLDVKGGSGSNSPTLDWSTIGNSMVHSN
ncbi:MAG: hypothetical protein ACRC5M_07390, partial [Anaeroplasmataceae bacterium]